MEFTITEIILLTFVGLAFVIPTLIFIGKRFNKIAVGKWVTLEQRDSNTDKFIKFFLSYQIDLDELHDKHIEMIEIIQEIEYRKKMKDQMGRCEKTLDILRDRVMGIFMTLLKEYYGENINALDSIEYRSFEGIILLTFTRIKSMFREMMVENHLSSLTEESAKEWRNSAAELIVSEAVRGFHKYYPAEFDKPPRSVVCKKLFEDNKMEFWMLADSTLEATRQIAIRYEQEIVQRREDYESTKKCFSEKWKNKIKDIFKEDIVCG